MSLLRSTPTGAPSHPPAVLDVSVWTGGRWAEHQDVLLADGLVSAVRDHVDVPPGPPGPPGQGRGRGGGEAGPVVAGALDGRGAHLLPGFVNTHTHLQQATCRGVGEGQPLLSWLLAVGTAMTSITPESAYLAAVAAALEGLRSGTTTLVEHAWPHPSPQVHDAVLAALRDVGVRAVFGRGVADRADPSRRWGFDPRLMQPLDSAFAEVERLSAAAGPRTQLALAVPNPRSLTPQGLHQVRSFAQDHDLTVMIHLLETVTDDVMCREHAGVGALDYLAAEGFLWDRLLVVHGVELDAAALAAFAEHGVAVSYNPLSNMRLGSGVAPVLAMLDAGVAVGLGVDGAGSNDRQDMLETLRIGAYLQRAHHHRADVLDFAAMAAIAYDGASRALGLPPRPEGVAPGVPADLTLVRFDRDFACLPVTDPGASLLTTASPRVVDVVLVAGEVVVADGLSTRIDERAFTDALLDLGAARLPGR